MHIPLTQKTSVLGVLCVPETLKASNDAVFSDGTQVNQSRNTRCSEHELCSAPPLPEGKAVESGGEGTTAQTSADGDADPRGAWGIEAFDPFDGLSLPVSSTCRWVLIPDGGESCLLWEWNPWQTKDDIDELFGRVRDGVASAEDHVLFDACMIDRFIMRVTADQPVEPWIMKSLADAFFKVLLGGEWNDEIRLPGRPTTEIRPWRDNRDLGIYIAVTNAVNGRGMKVTEAITATAGEHSVSYEAARAAYYRWKKQLSKNQEKP